MKKCAKRKKPPLSKGGQRAEKPPSAREVPRRGGGREPCHGPKYFGQSYSSLPHRLRAEPPRRGGQGGGTPFSTCWDFLCFAQKKSQHHGRGRACPARGLTESARLREPPRADIESAPTGNRCRPLQWRTAGVHPANPSFNNNRRTSWKTSPAGGGLLCVNSVYLLILSIAANSSGVNVVCSTALMLSRICCVLEAPIRTVVTSSWCSSQARAISARV